MIVTTIGLSVVLAMAGTAPPPFAGLEKAPEVRLSDLEGKQVALTWAGSRLTLVNFWATWCLPCRDEMPDIARLQTRFESRGFRAVGVALASGSREEIKTFLQAHPEFGINYTMLVGSETTMDDFGGIEIVPMTLLVDSGGAVVKTFLGTSEGFHDKVGKVIEELLAKPAEPVKPDEP